MSDKIRILQVGKYLPPVAGGMETAVYELGRGLSKNKNLVVSCLVANTNAHTVIEEIDGMRIIRAASFGSFASTPVAPRFKCLGATIESDILHLHLPNPLATTAFHNTHQPFVITYHCDIVRYPTLLKFYMPFLKRFLDRARRIITTSEELQAHSPVLRHYERKTTVIPLGINTSHLTACPERDALAKLLRERFQNRIVLFVGRLVPYKGLAHLITAMKEVNGSLVIVGMGPEEGKLKTLAKDLGLEPRIHFTGFIAHKELGAYYHAANVVALTSINESEAFGMSLLDGLASGKPLVTTDLPTGITRVNIDGVTGFRAPVGNIKAIAQNLNRLLDDPALQESMGAAGLRHFSQNFESENMISSHLKLYHDVLGR